MRYLRPLFLSLLLCTYADFVSAQNTENNLSPSVFASARDQGPADGNFEELLNAPSAGSLVWNGFTETRFAAEFDISNLGGSITSATLTGRFNSNANRGLRVDAFTGNGAIELADFAQDDLVNEELFPSGASMFTFDIAEQLRAAIVAGGDFFGVVFRESPECPDTFDCLTLSVSPTSLELQVVSARIEDPAALQITPGSNFDFGNLDINNGEVCQGFITTNTGANEAVTGIATSLGGQPTFFGTGDCGVVGNLGTLAPGASCTSTICFDPTTADTFNGTLDFVSDANNITVTLQGEGTATPRDAILETTPGPTFNFGSLDVNVGEVCQVFTTSNTGANNTVTGIATSLGGQPTFLGTGGCGVVGDLGTLAPGASCTSTVCFNPTTADTFTGTLDFFSDANNTTVPLKGRGTGILDEVFSDRFEATSRTNSSAKRSAMPDARSPEVARLPDSSSSRSW